MYLTAHRPVVAADELLGINSYLYEHRARWDGYPPAALPQPAFLRGHENAPRVRGSLRRLRSYLDVIGPDDVTVPEIREAVVHLGDVIASGSHGPWSHVCRRSSVTLALDGALTRAWHAELHWLWAEAWRLWSDPAYGNVAA
ncbi:MAG: hypothetical protein WKG00_33980 [Polyangiaceae bacterium]